MRMPTPLLAWPLCGAALFLAAMAPGTDLPVPSGPTPKNEVRDAPDADPGTGPEEATLTPPPDSEKVPRTRGFVVVPNPAFPGPRARPAPPPPPPDLGPRFEEKDLAPYFAEGHLLEARSAFGRGHYQKTRDLLAEETSLPARYLRALAAVRAELHEPAAAEMAALAEEYTALRDRCLTHAGIAHEKLKQYDRAAELLTLVRRGSRLYADARLALFRSLRSAGRLDQAVAALAPVLEVRAPSWGRNVAAEALWAVADLEKARKRPAAERDVLLRLWGQHPLSSLARQAEARLDLKSVPLERQVDRAESLIDAHRNRAGIEYLQPKLDALKLPDPLACRAHFAVGKALRKEREHARAIAVLAPVVEKCADPELRPRALYVLASSRSIAQASYGSGVYETLARDYPDHSFADDALFYASELYLKNDDVPSALARLAEISQRYPDGDYAAEALFKSFWIRRSQGDRQAALAVLDQLDAVFAQAPESYERERSRYWRGRMHEAEGEVAQAVALFERLAVDHPATYYGLISRRKLQTLDAAAAARVKDQLTFPPAGSVWPLYPGSLAQDPHFLAAVELYRLGFPEAVTSELLAANRTRAPVEGVRLVVVLLSLVDDARAAHGVARTSLRGDLSGRITSQNRAVWELAYPLAFRDLLEKHTREAGIEVDLLQALMREESALDPRAMSWAGALGLTQLMPYTARSVAARLGIKNITPERLLDPDLNIRLGAAYLGDLMKRFNGTQEYALAGYNAGGGAVSRWRRDRPDHALDEWVEEIPISETRGYVKRVLRSYNTYQLLYAPAPSSQTAAR
jgi:soluble lytic murein transglycosylase